jgi:hypothetical protein
MNPAGQPPEEPAQELAGVKRREAEFRLKTVQEFLAFGAREREHRAKIDALNDELGRRNTYIHELHAEREAFVRREQGAFADVEAFTRMLADAEAQLAAARAELARLKAPRGWRKWMTPAPVPAANGQARPVSTGSASADSVTFRASAGSADRLPELEPVPAGDFIYYLHTPPFRLYRAASFTLRGWALPRDGRAITGIRVRLAGREFLGEIGREEPGVIAQHGAQPANPHPGFAVEFATPAGRHELSLEAQLEHREWRSILTTPIWCQPTAP